MALAVANGYTAKIDPEAWAIVDDKLYLNYSKDVQTQWSAGRPGQHHQGATPTGRSIRADLGRLSTPPRAAETPPSDRRLLVVRSLDLPVAGMSISQPSA